jgi:hypothetical protein
VDLQLSQDVGVLEASGALRLVGPFKHLDDAWSAAESIVAERTPADTPVEVIGNFVIPSVERRPSRDFQTLHFDFGVPLVPVVPGDVARFTALHLLADERVSEALTRLVPLHALLGARHWPDRHELIRRFAAYGASHGAWDDAAGYVEGSLARIVEAALGQTPVLPSVKTEAGFLCGAEFTSLEEEQRFLNERNLHPEEVGVEVRLQPGELLVFDNLLVAHGRRGRRRAGELHQRVFGHRGVPVEQQSQLRDRVLAAFAS